jgi:GMP synthase-like glutamine amidotransferase
MSVLICKNIITEGPGTIEDYLIKDNIPYTIIELASGEKLPNPDNFHILIMMGGPMSVNEDEIYPYIKEEEKLVRDFISKGKKILGVCLGAQIIAKALGAKVYKGHKEEIGWYAISATEDGLRDKVFSSLLPHNSKLSTVFHWHGETFDIPDGAVRLASSALYPNQAFRHGYKAYAFQFHIEVRKEMILEWLKNEPNFRQIEIETETFFEEYRSRAENFYKGFFS